MHDTSRVAWAQDPAFDALCLKGGAHSLTGNFSFGIYALAVPIVGDVHSPVNKIVLPLFWGIMTMRYPCLSPKTFIFLYQILYQVLCEIFARLLFPVGLHD